MPNKNTKIFREFGDALGFLLADMGIEQQWLAKKLDVGDDQISNYVKNKSTPRAKRRARIGKILGAQFERNGSGWVLHRDDSVRSAAQAVKSAESEISGNKTDQPSRDEILQSLELAEKLIRRCRKLLND